MLDPDIISYKYARKILWDKKLSAPMINIGMGHELLSVVSPDNEFSFEADADKRDGSLSLRATLAVPRKLLPPKRYKTMPHLSDLFSLTLDYFGKWGINISEVNGSWPKTWNVNQKNINYEVFYQNLQRGLSPEEAAFQTPTGKLAKRHGFTIVEIIEHQHVGDEEGADVKFIKARS